MLLIGWRARVAAAVLFLFIIPTTLAFHAFWSVDPEATQDQVIQFLKNLAMMGACCTLWSTLQDR